MAPWHDLGALAAIFSQLSLLAFGGGNSVLPEMQRQVVTVHHWMSAHQFVALYALAQAAPGPNMLVVALIGWNVAGLVGALTATLALCAPSSLLTFFASGIWERLRAARWRDVVQRGLVPVTVGLVMAGAILLSETTVTGWRTGVLTLVAVLVFTRTRIHPLWVLAASALLGASGILG